MAGKDLAVDVLSPEEKIFVSSFLLDRNVKFTAQRVGLPVSACYAMLKRPEVCVAITEKAEAIAEKCDLSVEMVLNEFKRIALYDIKEHVQMVRTNVPESQPVKNKKKQKEAQDFHVQLKDFDEIDGRAISEISEKIGRYGIPEIVIKTHDKVAALKALLEWFKGGNQTVVNINQFNIGEMKGQTAQELSANYQILINK